MPLRTKHVIRTSGSNTSWLFVTESIDHRLSGLLPRLPENTVKDINVRSSSRHFRGRGIDPAWEEHFHIHIHVLALCILDPFVALAFAPSSHFPSAVELSDTPVFRFITLGVFSFCRYIRLSNCTIT